MTELAIEVKFLTHVGRKRQHNEDFVDFHEPADSKELARSGRLYMVADGVGGGAAGEVASEYAVSKILHQYYRLTEPDLGERLRAAIHAANTDIFEHVEQQPELGRMGTTIVAAAIRGSQLVVANVGDSRAYLIRNGEIHQITRDHSLVAKLVEEGSITPEEAEHHPKRNVVLRSIGADPDVYPDIFEGQLQPGDQIVLCSDGLTRYVSDSEIMDVATRTRADRTVEQLVEMANVRGGKDNISVMLLRVTEPIPPSALVGKGTEPRALTPPEFDTIHDTIRKRRRIPSRLPRPPRPTWEWLAFGGVIGVLVLLLALFVGRQGLGIIPALKSPTPELGSTITSSFTETLSSLVTPSPTPIRTTAPSSTPIPTSIPTLISTTTPISTPVPALSSTSSPTVDPLGDVGTYDTGAPVEHPPAGLDIRSASVASDLHVELEPIVETPPELFDWTKNDELLLWIAFHDPIPVSPTTNIDWLFALDLDGSVATGRPPNSVRINPDLGYEATIGVSYDRTADGYQSFFLVWDPVQGSLMHGPEMPRFGFYRERTLIGLALPLKVLAQTVQQTIGVTVIPEAVRGRAAAVSYEPDSDIPKEIDFYPGLPEK